MHQFNTILLGRESSGKTQLFKRIIERDAFRFDETINQGRGVDFKLTSFDACKQLHISDLPGSERFSSVLPSYYEKAEIALFCVDLTEEFSEAEIRKELAVFKSHNQIATVVLVGTKSEHPRAQAAAFQQMQLGELCSNSFVVSAKNNIGVDELLNFLHNLCLTQLRAPWNDAVHLFLKNIEILPEKKRLALKNELDILSQQLMTYSPLESLDIKASAIHQFTVHCETILSNNYSKVLKAAFAVAVAGFVTVLAALLGFGIGFALGAWSGPGAFISGIVGASMAAVAVTTTSTVTGVLVGGFSAYGLFKTPQGGAEVKQLAEKGLDLNCKGNF